MVNLLILMNLKSRNILKDENIIKVCWESDAIAIGEIEQGSQIRYVAPNALIFGGIVDDNERVLFSKGYVMLEARAREKPIGPYRIALRCLKKREKYVIKSRYLDLFGWNLERPEDIVQMPNLGNLYLDEHIRKGEITEEIALERARNFAANDGEYNIAQFIEEELKDLERRRAEKKE